MRIILEEEAVHIGARIAFVCIRNHEFVRPILPRDGTPLPASRKACAAPSTQTRSIEFIENLPRLSEECGLERGVPSARQVIREAPCATRHQICEDDRLGGVNFEPWEFLAF
jgi:hypothetical protein